MGYYTDPPLRAIALNPLSMTYFITPPSFGIGDLVVSIPIVQQLISRGHETAIIAHSNDHLCLAQRIDGLKEMVLSSEFAVRKHAFDDIHLDFRAHPLQRNYWWISNDFASKFPRYKIGDILKHMCRDFGVYYDKALLHPLISQPRKETLGKIIFIPGSAGSSKCWPSEHWFELNMRLRALGFGTVMIGRPRDLFPMRRLIKDGLKWHVPASLDEALDFISSAHAVISVDTGLMHLSIQQSRTTIGIYKHSPLYLREFPHSFPVIAKEPCFGACYKEQMKATGGLLPGEQPAFRMRDWDCINPESGCMASIGPESVLKAVRTALSV